MFFSAKTKGFFIDQGDHTLLIARTSSVEVPFVVEQIHECVPGDAAGLAEALKALLPKKSPSGYLHANCGIYSARRAVRRVTLDLKRVRDPAYLNEVATQQLRIDPEQFTLALLNSGDGMDYEVAKATQKDAIMCGLPTNEITATQDQLLATGIYPERLEVTSVAVLGALIDYLAFSKAKIPTLMLEIGADLTHSFIVTSTGVEASRPIPQGLDAMVPVVQKELGLRDEESARKLFFSNTFDFTGMGPVLIKKLLKELQSSIGFYEVQTGQSIGQVICTLLPPKLGWLEAAIASQLGVTVLKPDLPAWLQSRQITLADSLPTPSQDSRRLGLFSLMANYTRHVVAPEKAS